MKGKTARNNNGWPLWSNEKGIKSMDDTHIHNTIRWIEQRWEQFSDENDYIVADHWSLTGVVFVPGKPWYEERLVALREEKARRELVNEK